MALVFIFCQFWLFLNDSSNSIVNVSLYGVVNVFHIKDLEAADESNDLREVEKLYVIAFCQHQELNRNQRQEINPKSVFEIILCNQNKFSGCILFPFNFEISYEFLNHTEDKEWLKSNHDEQKHVIVIPGAETWLIRVIVRRKNTSNRVQHHPTAVECPFAVYNYQILKPWTFFLNFFNRAIIIILIPL